MVSTLSQRIRGKIKIPPTSLHKSGKFPPLKKGGEEGLMVFNSLIPLSLARRCQIKGFTELDSIHL